MCHRLNLKVVGRLEQWRQSLAAATILADMKPNPSLTDEHKIWITAHAYVKTLLGLYRDHGFQMTGLKTWDFMKWNALGPPMISRQAIERFMTERLADGSPLMKGSTVREFTSGKERRGRCFVAEHVYPTKMLQKLIFKRYASCDPSLEEVRDLFERHNRICYVWYEEDKRLTDANLRSSVPEASSKEAEDPLARYRADGVGIEPLETNLKDGHAIFRKLTTCRKEGFGITATIKSLT
jgi:hypothetical protein